MIQKKITTLIILLLTFSGFVESQNLASYIWSELGPTNLWAKQGRINYIAFDPVDDNIMYAGAPTGSIWKTTDAGKTWITDSDFEINTGVSVIAVNPSNSNIIYIGTGDKSGQTFSKTGTGIYKSTDKGKTWTNINQKNKFTNVYHILINPDNTNQIFINTTIGFYKSENGGTLWTKINTTNYRDIKFKPVDADYIYAVTENDFSKYSISTGTFTTTKFSETGYCRLAVSEAEPNSVYVIINNKGLFKSENQGSTFVKISEIDIDNFFQLYSYCFCFVADNQNADIMYVGTRFLWRSLDGGVTWEKKNSLHPDNHFLGFSNSDQLFCGNDGGICYTTDNAETWTNLNSNLSITQVYDISSSTDGNLIIIGTQDNGASICEYDETSFQYEWKNIITADVMRCQIDYSDDNIIYFSNYYPGGLSRVRKSTDKGKSNNIIANPGKKGIDSKEYFQSRIFFVLDNVNHDVMYLGGRDLYKSENLYALYSDISWEKISDFDGTYTITEIVQSYKNRNFAYLSRGLSFLYYTENLSGDSVVWTKITTPETDINAQIKALAIHPANDDILYIIQSDKIYKTMNRGKTWTNITYNLTDFTLNCIALDIRNEEDIYLGTSAGVYFKDILKTSWTKISSSMPDYWITDIEISYSDENQIYNCQVPGPGKIRAATYGRGVWETDLLK